MAIDVALGTTAKSADRTIADRTIEDQRDGIGRWSRKLKADMPPVVLQTDGPQRLIHRWSRGFNPSWREFRGGVRPAAGHGMFTDKSGNKIPLKNWPSPKVAGCEPKPALPPVPMKGTIDSPPRDSNRLVNALNNCVVLPGGWPAAPPWYG